jgi:hypothetical protein
LAEVAVSAAGKGRRPSVTSPLGRGRGLSRGKGPPPALPHRHRQQNIAASARRNGFRWATAAQHEPRILRLFARGHREEDNLAELLRKAGVTVMQTDPATGQQFKFGSGHFGGSMDGACIGVPDAPKTWHVLEFKTASAKAFNDLAKKGVQASKPEHWAQMQCYMAWTGMTRALYVALNKNTDEIYIERIDYDAKEFKRIKQKAKEIIFANAPPPRMNESPAYFKCKWCAFNGICHEQGEVAEMNCRTCQHSAALEDGSWACDKHNMILTTAGMEVGCADHKHREGMAPQSVRDRKSVV